jgi:hypothetical protein
MSNYKTPMSDAKFILVAAGVLATAGAIFLLYILY